MRVGSKKSILNIFDVININKQLGLQMKYHAPTTQSLIPLTALATISRIKLQRILHNLKEVKGAHPTSHTHVSIRWFSREERLNMLDKKPWSHSYLNMETLQYTRK